MFFLNFWLAVNNWLFLASWSLPMTRAFGDVLEKLLLVDLEICFLALLGEVLLVRVRALSRCLSGWRRLKSWMYQVLLRLPRVVLAVVALPPNQVLGLPFLVPPLVHDPFHLCREKKSFNMSLLFQKGTSSTRKHQQQ